MKRLAVFAVLASKLAACEQQTPKTEGGGGAAAGTNPEMMEALRNIDRRLKGLETAHTPGSHGGGQVSLVERVHQLEAQLARREEALQFLEMAYAQQKQQQEAKEASEPDPNAIFAVDISGAVKNNQTEGPSNAIITIVEAWDFA
jgi:hypothetical protein